MGQKGSGSESKLQFLTVAEELAILEESSGFFVRGRLFAYLEHGRRLLPICRLAAKGIAAGKRSRKIRQQRPSLRGGC